MRLKIIRPGKLNRVRRHHRQTSARGQLHRGHDMRFIVGAAGALQLQVKPMGKHARQLQCGVQRARHIALQQRLPHRPGLGAGQDDQALAQFFQPVQLDAGLRLVALLRPGARQQLRQIEVTLLVLHQQQQARQRAGILAQPFEPDFGANQRLDAALARRFVKLDGAKQIAQVGDGQSRLAVSGRGLDAVANAVGAVNDGKFSVQTKVDKHGSF